MTAEKRQYYATRKHFRPVVGKIYENEGGGVFKCLPSSEYYSDYNAVLVNILSGWTFAAHGIGVYIDGRIDWDYSTDGYFGGLEA